MKRSILAAAAVLFLLAPACAPQQAAHTEVREQLSQNVRPTRYTLTVTPDAQALTLQGDVSIDLEVAQPTREIVLNANQLTLASVTLDGTPVTDLRYQESNQTEHLGFAQNVAAGRHVLAIRYSGKINQQAQGMFAADYEANHHSERMLVTQFEAADARRFLPCFDEPAFRSVFDLTIVAPANRVVISNMPQASSEALPNNQKRVHFAPTPAMPSYLLFVGVGDFERVTTHAAGVEINVWTKRGDAEKGRFALNAAAQVLPYYNDYFGTPYPLPKLDIIAAPGNSFGFAAMENWGAILFFEEYSLVDPTLTSEARRQFVYTTVAHEIAHMWFGDLVTMAWWDDLWLNEGFATWMENKASNQFHPEWNLWMQAQTSTQNAMLLDARTTSHPIVVPIHNVDEANDAFDNITYDKGYAVIRMFETYVGEDLFRNGVRAYIHAKSYGNARTSDLWDAIQQASGHPVRQIADDFTRQPGVPLISVTAGACANNHQALTLTQSEFTSTPVTRQPLLWRVPVAAHALTGGATGEALTGDDHHATLDLADCGPFIVNPDQAGYFRTVYPQAQFDALAQNFAHVPAADQLGLLYDARALGRAGQAPASQILALAKQTPLNADPLVWTLIAGEIGAVDALYGDDPRRERFRTFARTLIDPVFARVGWRRVRGESDNVSLLRAQLINTLSQLAEPSFEAEALRRYHAGGIDGSVRAAVMNAVGGAATPQVFDDLLAHARGATDTLEKQLYYEALANTRDEALARRALDLALSAEVQGAEGPRLVTFVSFNHTALAMDYAAQHQNELAGRLDWNGARAFQPSISTSSNDPAMLTRVRGLINALPQGGRRSAEASYAQLAERLQTRTRRLTETDAWLQQQH